MLSADHGSIDAAERVAARGVPAERLNADVVGEVGAAVQAELKLDFQPLAGDPQQINITGFGERDPKLEAQIATAATRLLRARSDVVAVFSRAEIAAAVPPAGKPVDELTLAERFHESYDPERSGDIAVAYKPYSSGGAPAALGDYVAGHGSPWNYDRRVPMLFWWPSASGFEQPLPVETVDIAPTLAALLGVPTPAVDGRCLDLDVTAAGNSCAAAAK